MPLLSPGFETKETSTTNTIVRSSTGRAALVGKFQWGPAFQVTQITNEIELVNKFGTPTDHTADYFMSGANFLQYGNDLRVVRVLDVEKAKNASTIAGNVSHNITNAGTNYEVGDKFTIKHDNDDIEENGVITKVGSDGQVLAVFIPSAKIIHHLKSTGDFPTMGNNWTIKAAVGSGGNGQLNIEMTSIETDSQILLTDLETAADKMRETEYLEHCKRYSMPSIAAIYAGELGDDLEVEIVDKHAFDEGRTLTVYPFGGEREMTANKILPYGPQTENQYAIIVRRGGVVVDSRVLSTVRGEKDVYGSSIYMNDYFNKGSSNYVFAVAEGWVHGFHGIIKLQGGLSANAPSTDAQNDPFTGALMRGWDLFADREGLHVNLMIAGACAGEAEEVSCTVQKHVSAIGDERQDCLVLISPPRAALVNVPVTSAVDNLVNWRTAKSQNVTNNMNINSTYSEIDGNYKYQYDKYNDVNRWVPLSADIAGLCARTDVIAQPWMSPAGYNRGQILNCIKLAIEPRPAHRDRLYQIGINPVIGTSGEGFILYGDKTATSTPTPFDRINVRRLFNMLKKSIGDASKYKLFENNDNFTRSSFRMETGQYLDTIRSLGGVYDFRVICDTTNNTPDVIDRNEFVATFRIKPAKSINYIYLNFTADATGANFDEIVGIANYA